MVGNVPVLSKVARVRPLQWVRELESGTYEQCRDYLHRDDCFCAIGVLLDMAGAAWIEVSQGSYGLADAHGVPRTKHVGPETFAELGLPWVRPLMLDLLVNTWNDQGWSFHQIAEGIRREIAEASTLN